MKRDMDLVRRILLAASDLPFGESLKELEGVSSDDFVQHVIWLNEAGLIKAWIVEMLEGEQAEVQRLTWSGCDFTDAIRNDTLWAKAKGTVLKPSMSFTFDVLKDWLKAEIAQGLPTLRTLGQ